MLTPDSLNTAARTYRKLMAIPLLALFAGIILMKPLSERVSPFLASFGLVVAPRTASLLLLLLMAGVVVALIHYLRDRTMLSCPKCRTLIEVSQIPLVIATKCCGKCGEVIVSMRS
jgi:hypothetical protein